MIVTEKQGKLEYLRSDAISVPHCFTTRYGGVSTGSLASLNIAFKEGERMENVERNISILGSALGFDTGKMVLTRQTHGDLVRIVTAADHRSLCHRDYPECDGLVTMEPGVSLLVYTADCTPILLWDPVTGAVGAAHAGWRGTAAKIGARAVEKMMELGAKPENIRAAIGPNIGMCHFETDADVPEAMLASYGPSAERYITRKGEKYYLDLKAINALSLRELGVEQIDISADCTVCQSERFWSHRVTRGDRGSQGAVITCGGSI